MVGMCSVVFCAYLVGLELLFLPFSLTVFLWPFSLTVTYQGSMAIYFDVRYKGLSQMKNGYDKQTIKLSLKNGKAFSTVKCTSMVNHRRIE